MSQTGSLAAIRAKAFETAYNFTRTPNRALIGAPGWILLSPCALG
jgi:hypothetical protein